MAESQSAIAHPREPATSAVVVTTAPAMRMLAAVTLRRTSSDQPISLTPNCARKRKAVTCTMVRSTSRAVMTSGSM